jgi:hypothetical protein
MSIRNGRNELRVRLQVVKLMYQLHLETGGNINILSLIGAGIKEAPIVSDYWGRVSNLPHETRYGKHLSKIKD